MFIRSLTEHKIRRLAALFHRIDSRLSYLDRVGALGKDSVARPKIKKKYKDGAQQLSSRAQEDELCMHKVYSNDTTPGRYLSAVAQPAPPLSIRRNSASSVLGAYIPSIDREYFSLCQFPLSRDILDTLVSKKLILRVLYGVAYYQ